MFKKSVVLAVALGMGCSAAFAQESRAAKKEAELLVCGGVYKEEA
jgi:hypothetical protein